MKWDEWRGDLDGRVVMRIKRLINFKGFRLDLHKFIAEDSADCFHTHPAIAIRLVLFGGYIEELESGKLVVWKPLRIGIVRPSLSHRTSTLLNPKRGSYSLWFRFPKTRKIELRGTGWPESAKYTGR